VGPLGKNAILLAPLMMLLVSTVSVSQNSPKVTRDGLPKTSTESLKAEQCMQKISAASLEALDQRVIALEEEIEDLCNVRARDEAQELAQKFAKSMMQDQTVKALRRCAEMTGGIVDRVPFLADGHQEPDGHVCDE